MLDTDFLEIGKNYLPAFKVQLQNEQGEIFKNMTVHVRVVSEENMQPSTYGSLVFVSDEEGYLTFQGERAEFQVFDGCHMEIFMSYEEHKYFEVNAEGDMGICVISGLY